jgi:hypothetical protein
MGYAGDFPVTLTAEGFTWSIPAGPMTIRYHAIVKDGTWTEVGDRIVPGKEPERLSRCAFGASAMATGPAWAPFRPSR